MNNYSHYLNGEFVHEKNLLISPMDLGFSRGYAVFAYLKTYNGKPVKLHSHIKRLLMSAELIGLEHNLTLKQITDIVSELLKRNDDKKEKILRIYLSGGISDSMYQSSDPTLIVIVDIYKPKPQKYYETGVKMGLTKFARYLPLAKCTNYIEGIRVLKQKRNLDIYEPIYYTDQQVHEASNCNVFAVKNGIVYTPKNNILLGLTREVLIEDLKDKINVIEFNFDLDFLLNADEVFVTSSGKGVIPVIRIEEYIIGNGEVGKITKQVMKEYEEYLSKTY